MTYSQMVLQDGAIVYWRANTPATFVQGQQVPDASGHGITGGQVQIVGGNSANNPSLINDATGKSMLLNNTSGTTTGAIVSSTVTPLTSTWQIEIWTKPVSFPATNINRLLFSNSNIQLSLRNTGKVFCLISDAGTGGNVTFISATSIVLSSIYHLFLGNDGSQTYLYINGVLDTAMPTGGLTKNASAIKVGNNTGQTGVNAFVQEAAIYDKPLTAAQILAHYNKGING